MIEYKVTFNNESFDFPKLILPKNIIRLINKYTNNNNSDFINFDNIKEKELFIAEISMYKTALVKDIEIILIDIILKKIESQGDIILLNLFNNLSKSFTISADISKNNYFSGNNTVIDPYDRYLYKKAEYQKESLKLKLQDRVIINQKSQLKFLLEKLNINIKYDFLFLDNSDKSLITILSEIQNLFDNRKYLKIETINN